MGPLIDLVFIALKLAMLVHIVLSLWRTVARWNPHWEPHPLLKVIDRIGSFAMRPFRKLFDRLGITKRTAPLDLSPIAAFFLIDWVHALVRWIVRG